MKKRVRIYKAKEGGEGRYINSLSRFIPTAQDGMQQQTDPQQLIAQVAALVAPPPYGEGQDPTQVYQTLAQSYGEEVASQLINAAAAYVQQIVAQDEGSGNQQAQASDDSDLNYQEELIRQEQQAQEEEYNNAAMAEDDYMFDEMLMEDNPALQEEQQMRLGGAKKRFVKDALKLAKKQLGDTGDQNNGKADSTDVLDGRQKKSSDFLTTIKNQATLSTIEKQAKNIAETIFKPEPRLQMGGFTGQDLFKFVYGGGDDPSVPALTQAENGIEIRDSTGKTKMVTQEEADAWNQAVKDNLELAQKVAQEKKEDIPQNSALTFDDLGFASESPVTDTTNWKNWNNLITQGYGSNIGDYREGVDYSRVNTSNFGKKNSGQGSANYNNIQNQYGTGTILDALLPGNGIFNKTYTMNGTNFGAFNPRQFMEKGFNMDKERLGFGHKRYTFTPIGSEQVTAQNKNQQKQKGEFWNRLRGVGFAQDAGINNKNSFDLFNRLRGIGRAETMAYGGMPKYQGAVTGSSVNTQVPDTDFKPRTDWQKPIPGFDSNNQYSIQGALGITEKDLEKYQDPSLTVDEKTSLNGENFLNIFNPAAQGLANVIENIGERGNVRDFYNNLDSTNQYTAVDPQFRGNYEINSGLFRPDQMGQLWQSREGGQRRKTGQQSDWGLSIFPTAMGGSDINQYLGTPQPQVQDSLSAVPRDEANLEAEGGETAFGDINGDGFPEHMKIVGPRHSSGGVPLNLPDDTFIFSDTRSMKITDPKILKMFNKPSKKGGYTPAELAKPYDINKYRKILDDPDSDIVDRKTAELMIKNFNVKLGALALAQESKKGFPQGIPVVARPYMEMMGIQDEDLIPEEPQEQQAGFSPSPEEVQMMQSVDETGMPPVDQMAMQQEDMSGMPMEGMPMAAYGMAMGGYGMPFYQDGGDTMDYTEYINEEPVTMNRRDMRISQKPYYHMEPASPTNPNPDRYWLTAGDRLKNLRSFITGERPDLPSSGVSYQFQDGGELEMYQDRGEVKSKNKIYKESELPKDAVIKSPYSTDIRIGDFVKQPDGTYLNVTRANFKATEVDTKTRPGTAMDFYNQSAENKAIMDKANEIIEREIRKGTIQKIGANKINILGTLNIPFRDQIALSRAFNSNAEFGTNKYKIASQKSTPGYSAGPGKGSFVSGFNPEIYEQRYIFEKARGQGATDDEAYAELERVLADPKAKANLRREYAAFLGLKNIPADDAELLKTDFYKNRYGEVTKGLESVLAKSSNRPALGDDLWAGYEHFDALGLSPDLGYEGLPEEKKEDIKDENDIDQDEEVTTPYRGDAPWWLQDQLKMAGAFGDLMSINKYYPWAPKYEPIVPEPTFLDPTRSIAAQSEQAKILGDTMAQFSPSAALAAGRVSGLQGQLAKGVADTTNQYDAANVQIANQFAPVQADIYNKAQMYNQGVSKQLYDANTIMNQQYDNSKRALRNNLLNQYTNAITNRWKTDALNQLYPQFAVDPSVGGQMYYTGQGKKLRPESSKSLDELYKDYYEATGDRDAAQKFAMLQYKQNQSGYSSEDLYPAEAMMSLYGNMQQGGTFTFGPGMMPPLIL